jgi:hypothetical protein
MPIAPTTKKISHPFGENRGKRRHNGIDYDVDPGTPVKASADGIVVRSTNHEPSERLVLKKQVNNMGEKEKKFFGSYGNVIIIYHGQDLKKLKHTYTLYAHLDHRSVRANERVKEGQMIATAGNSGTSHGYYGKKGGYNLHFEVLESSAVLKWVKTGPLDHYFASESKRIDPERFFRRSCEVVWLEKAGNFFALLKHLHYIRNTFNDIDPSEIKDIINEKKGWKKLGFFKSRLHKQGSAKELYHWKYKNKDGREAVLDNDEKLVTGSLNKGTYNYGSGPEHAFQDWLPYIIWGNTRDDDPTSWFHRLWGTYHTKE